MPRQYRTLAQCLHACVCTPCRARSVLYTENDLVASKSAEHATELWCQLSLTQATYNGWSVLQQRESDPPSKLML